MLWIGCFVYWLMWFTYGHVNLQVNMTCQLYWFLYYVFKHASVWVLVCMTGERCAAIMIPLKAKTFSNIKVAKIVSSVIVSVWVVLESQWFFTATKIEGNGAVCCNYFKYADFYEVFDNMFYSILPCVLIFVLNIVIISKLVLARLKYANSDQVSTLSKNAVSTSIMLLSVSITFTVLTIPWAVIDILLYIFEYNVSKAVYVLGMVLFYTNHSCNAIMYALLGKKFRQEVIKFLCRRGFGISSTENTESTIMSHGNKIGPAE